MLLLTLTILLSFLKLSAWLTKTNIEDVFNEINKPIWDLDRVYINIPTVCLGFDWLIIIVYALEY